MDCLLTEKTPRPVYDAVEALMQAETGQGPYRFLDEVVGHLHLLPVWGDEREGPDERHPLDEAIEEAAYHAHMVDEQAEARRWKAAGKSLKAVRKCQDTYWVRIHVEALGPIPGYVLRGEAMFDDPMVMVYRASTAATAPGAFLFCLPPMSSRDAVEAAITAWETGYRMGARHSMRAIRGTVDFVEGAL